MTLYNSSLIRKLALKGVNLESNSGEKVSLNHLDVKSEGSWGSSHR